MFRKSTVVAVFGLSVALICWVTATTAAENREAKIGQVQGAIKELEYGLKHHPDSQNVEKWKVSLAEYRQKLERLKAGIDDEAETKTEAESTADQIRKVEGAIKELEYGLEHHPDSEQVEKWKASLIEYKQKYEHLSAEAKAATHQSTDEQPSVSGDWVGTWGVLGAPNETQQRLDCRVVVLESGQWQATFEGECGRPYKYTIEMLGRQASDVVLFKGSVDLGEKDGGVYDWIGRATAEKFIGFYTSERYTGTFSLGREKQAIGGIVSPAPVVEMVTLAVTGMT